jgi:predicted RecA/RadA family phage recombinase
MATNEVYQPGDFLSVTCSHPATPVSGDPVRYGELVGVAQTAEQADGMTSVTFSGVHLLSVKGIDAGGNSAVAVGDRLYYTDADTPPISKKATGRFVGHAVETPNSAGTVTGGATAAIGVRLSN